jgi:acetyl esterase
MARRLLGRLAASDRNARGDRLDPSLHAMLGLERILGGGLDTTVPIAQRRADFTASCWLVAADPIDVPVRDTVVDGALHRYPVRFYEPPNATAGLVFFHGGGWVLGDLESHDPFCRRLAVQSNRVVVAVDYPRAPELRWPDTCYMAADAWQACRAALVDAHPSLERIDLGGDSAGGNLTANACRLLRDGSAPMPDRQILLYPGLDATLSCASHREFATGYVLTEESIVWYLGQYGPDPEHPLGSPALAPDLEGLPAALILVAGFDPLRDEGLLYANRLREVGVDVELMDCPSMLHGFLNMDGVSDRAGALVDDLAARLRIR